MAFCLKGILLLHVLVVTLQPLTGVPVKRSWSNRADTVHKARDILEPSQVNFLKRPEQTKRNPSSTFKFVNQSELAKGIDYLKKKYPDVDWSFVTPLPTPSISGKREFENKNSLEQTKKSSFTFLNQSEIAKGLDYLKKKYPDVDWSFVTPLPTLAGKRELEHEKRTFDFVNQSEIAKGFDYLKKKYPDVDWSFVMPVSTSSPGKRELEHGNSLRQAKRTFDFVTESEIAKGFDYLKKKYPDVDWSLVMPASTSSPGKRELEHGNSLRQAKRTFDFLNQSEIAKGFDYLKKKYPDVDWSFVMPVSTSSPGRRELEHGNSLRQAKRTFDFLNQSEIAKGFDYLKKKYPDVDWSFVMPASTSSPGRRELEHGNSLRQAKRTFDFLNQSEIAKGFDYLKKKYPDVDWSLVMPASTSSPGRRELKGQIMESKTNSITNKRLLEQQKKSLLDSGSIQQRNDIPRKHHNSEGSSKQKARDDFTSSFEFLDPEEIKKGLEYLLEKHP
jgi:putative NADH-flavin reductase